MTILTTFCLHATEELPVENSHDSASDSTTAGEVVESEKQRPQGSSSEGAVKRRWTKRARPGTPKARKAIPSRKKVALFDEQSVYLMDEEEDFDNNEVLD